MTFRTSRHDSGGEMLAQNYCPYLEAVSDIRNLTQTQRDLLTVHLNMLPISHLFGSVLLRVLQDSVIIHSISTQRDGSNRTLHCR
jgi:hypothetical protein